MATLEHPWTNWAISAIFIWSEIGLCICMESRTLSCLQYIRLPVVADSVYYIYLLEPCILVMYHSMRPHPAITATLLDFMCRVSFIITSKKDKQNIMKMMWWTLWFSIRWLCLTMKWHVDMNNIGHDHDVKSLQNCITAFKL